MGAELLHSYQYWRGSQGAAGLDRAPRRAARPWPRQGRRVASLTAVFRGEANEGAGRSQCSPGPLLVACKADRKETHGLQVGLQRTTRAVREGDDNKKNGPPHTPIVRFLVSCRCIIIHRHGPEDGTRHRAPGRAPPVADDPGEEKLPKEDAK